MKRILLIICLGSFGLLQAQTLLDGCITIDMAVTDTWVEEFEDPFFADENSLFWYGADNASWDGIGWRGGSCTQLYGSNFVGWRTIDEGGDDQAASHPVVNLFSQVYGASGTANAPVPQYLQLRGRHIGEDCPTGSDCSYDTGFSCLGDNDDYGYDDVLTTTLNYRFGPPNQYNYTNRFTSNHGGSDFGAETRTRWTAPIPNISASTSEICVGVPTPITLFFSGTASGGGYELLDGASTVYSGTATSFPATISVGKTYRLYSLSNGIRSNCYKEISITTKNCDFNCETRSYTTATTISPCVALSRVGSNVVSFNGFGIPGGSYISDVEVEVELTGDGDQMHLMFYSNNGATESTSLVDGIELTGGSGCYLTGTPYPSLANMNIIWDEDATAIVGNNYNPIDNGRVRSTCGNAQGVEFDKWESWGTTSATDWYLTAGQDDGGCNDFDMVVNNFAVTICGCKPPLSATSSITDGVTTTTGTLTICASQGGNLTLSSAGSASMYDFDGYGDELKWFSGSCGGTELGTGNNFEIPAPTVAGTYNYYAEYWVEGERCRAGNGNCDVVQVVVDALSEGGSLLSGGSNTETICIGSTPATIDIVGNVGSVYQWERSTDATNWSVRQTGGGSFSPDPLLVPGTYFYRASVYNNTCDTVYSLNYILVIEADPIVGTISPDTSICNGQLATLLVTNTTGAINWQSSASSGGPFVDIAIGGSTDTYLVTDNNTSTTDTIIYYRMKVSNAPCVSVNSNVIAVTISPTLVPGETGPDQFLCYNEVPADITLSNDTGGAVVEWQVDDVNVFTTAITIANTTNTLTGAEIQTAVGGLLDQTLYVRAVYDNLGCDELYSTWTTLRINDPEDITGIDGAGTCYLNTNEYVHIYNPLNDQIIASIDANGQNIGNTTVDVFRHGGSAFTVPTIGPNCSGFQQAVMNRSFVINSATAPSGPVSVRLYFTDAELNSLIATAGCGDANGCPDDDDVCGIGDLFVTQITGAASEDGTFTPGDGTAILHTPLNNGTGDATFGANYVQFTVNSFSEFWIHGSESGVPLPVEMLSFTAQTIENSFIQLDWSTATEINNAGFDIERSIDGFDFDVIAWEEGNGNSASQLNYNYSDHDVTPGTYYYRLRQVDFDGEYEYTSIVTASIRSYDTDQVGLFIPNPSIDQSSLDITLSQDRSVSIVLFNTLGQRILSKDLFLKEGKQSVDFDAYSLPSGTYSAVIEINDKTVVRKLVVSK